MHKRRKNAWRLRDYLGHNGISLISTFVGRKTKRASPLFCIMVKNEGFQGYYLVLMYFQALISFCEDRLEDGLVFSFLISGVQCANIEAFDICFSLSLNLLETGIHVVVLILEKWLIDCLSAFQIHPGLNTSVHIFPSSPENDPCWVCVCACVLLYPLIHADI